MSTYVHEGSARVDQFVACDAMMPRMNIYNYITDATLYENPIQLCFSHLKALHAVLQLHLSLQRGCCAAPRSQTKTKIAFATAAI